MTNQEIIATGQTIANETHIGGNTAERVGGVIEGIGENLTELKGELYTDTDETETTKEIVWNNGYIARTGVIYASTVSRFSSPILLKKGETVTVGTQNTNITIIGSTDASSLAVGDSVTPIEKTSSTNRYETHSYTATEDIYITVCVSYSNYSLSFKINRLDLLESEMSDIIPIIDEVDAITDKIDAITYIDDTNLADFSANTFLGDTSDLTETYNQDGSISFAFTESANPFAYYALNNLDVGVNYILQFEVLSGSLGNVANCRVGEWDSNTSTVINDNSVRTANGNIYTVKFASTRADMAVRIPFVYSSKSVTVGNFSLTKEDETIIIDNSKIIGLNSENLSSELNETIEGKLDKSQGVLNAGKFLSVSSDGNVICEELPQTAIAVEPHECLQMAAANESYKDSALTTIYTDTSVTATFSETVNPYLCYWIKGLQKGKTYNISFKCVGTLNSAGVFTYSAGGQGANFIIGLTNDNGVWSGQFIAPEKDYQEQNLVLRIIIKYNSKNNVFSNWSCVEADGVKNYALLPYRPLRCTFFGHSTTGVTYSGQSILFRFANGENMLADTHISTYAGTLRRWIYEHEVYNLDYLVITHYHSDHVGGLLYWIENGYLDNGYVNLDGATVFLPQLFTAEQIAAVSSTGDTPSTLVDRQTTIINTLTAHGCTIIHPTEGQTVKIGDAQIRFYNCDHSVYMTGGAHVSQNYNDFSLCFEVEYGAIRVNDTADIGPVGQAYIAGQMYPCDVMTAPHHGWDNGANNLIPAFINNANPQIVIATNGREHMDDDNLNENAHMDGAKSPIYSWADCNGRSVYPTNLNGIIELSVFPYAYRLDGMYTRYVRNGKNWKYSDNSEYNEEG